MSKNELKKAIRRAEKGGANAGVLSLARATKSKKIGAARKQRDEEEVVIAEERLQVERSGCVSFFSAPLIPGDSVVAGCVVVCIPRGLGVSPNVTLARQDPIQLHSTPPYAKRMSRGADTRAHLAAPTTAAAAEHAAYLLRSLCTFCPKEG